MSDKIIKSMFDDSTLSPLGIVKKDIPEDKIDGVIQHTLKEVGMDLESMLGNERDFIDFALDQHKLNNMSPSGIDWEWDLYQSQFFDVGLRHNLGYYYIANKCRQSGMSTAFAAKMFARAIMTPRGFEGVFVSYKKEEAINKIKYVRQFLDALPLSFHKKIVRDPLQLIEWENYDGSRARIFSHAQKPIRGTPANVIVLDELAFYNMAAQIYESAAPALGQTRGVLEITSTPFGKGGIFFEIFDDKEKYKNFYREWIYWWYCKRYLKPEYAKDELLPIIAMQALRMCTEERVEKFGNIHLIKFYETMDKDSFKQEFEGFFVDDIAAYFPREIINSVLFKDLEDLEASYQPRVDEFYDVMKGGLMSPEHALEDLLTPIMREPDYAGINFRKFDTIEDLCAAVASGEVSKNLFVGVDVGTSVNTTEITFLEEIKINNKKNLQVERLSISLESQPLPVQLPILESLLKTGIIKRMAIDESGIGKFIGQSLKTKYRSIVTGVDFSSGGVSKKEVMLKNLKARMEQKTIALYSCRETIEQIYSIKRVVSKTGHVSYEADERKRHHADKAISIALASIVGTPAIANTSIINVDRTLVAGAGYELNQHSPHHDTSSMPSSGRRVNISRARSSTNAKRFVHGEFIKNWDS